MSRTRITLASCLCLGLLITASGAAGGAGARTTRMSVRSNKDQGDGASINSSISSTGRFVAFESLASNLVPGDVNNVRDIFVHDRKTGKTTRVSVRSNGEQGNIHSLQPSISADGRFVAFTLNATNLVPGGDTNTVPDIFVHDRKTGKTTRVSVQSNGDEADNTSQYPSIIRTVGS